MAAVDGMEEAPCRAVVARVERLLFPVYTHKVAVPRDTFHEARVSDDVLEALGISQDVLEGDGAWITVSRQFDDVGDSFKLRLHACSNGAVLSVNSAPAGTLSPAVVYLPTNIIEALRATPGQSNVYVSLLPSCDEPAYAARVVVARVSGPHWWRPYEAALRTFFHVPRLLRAGELFSVPCEGIPAQLQVVEDGTMPIIGSVLPDADEAGGAEEGGREPADWQAVYRPGLHSASRSRDAPDGDPMYGHLFRSMFSFRVVRLQPAAARGAAKGGTSSSSSSSDDGRIRGPALLIDTKRSELLVQHTCHARDLPYISNHFFCSKPRPLPQTLQPAMKRLLGLLSPALRSWTTSSSSSSLPAAEPGELASTVLMVGAKGCGKRVLLQTVCARLGLHLHEVNCCSMTVQSGGVEDLLQQHLQVAAESSPAVLCLRRLQALSAQGPSLSPAALLLLQRRYEIVLRDTLTQINGMKQADGRRKLLILVGSCEVVEDVGAPIQHVFKADITLPRPDEQARTQALASLLPAYSYALGEEEEDPEQVVTPESIAKLTAGLSYVDLRSVCSELWMKKGEKTTAKKQQKKSKQKKPLTALGIVEQAVKRLQGSSKVAVTLAANVQWADIGGLQDAKDEVMNCITMPLEQAHAFGGQKARSGILLFGPPGTGKTLLAKAVATECRVHFLSVKGPELLSMYIGESEKNVRSLFQSARELQPCVLFFDELDALAPARGRGSDSGGVMDRVVSQLLTELDGLPATIFIIGATNRPDLLDNSLLRPGRLDRMVYLGIAADKLPLLKAVTRKFELDEASAKEEPVKQAGGLLEAVAKHCPLNLTGADVASLCAEAFAVAQKDRIELLDELASRVAVSVSTLLLFLEALEESSTTANVAGVTAASGSVVGASASSASSLMRLYPMQEAGKSCLETPHPGLALYTYAGDMRFYIIANHLAQGVEEVVVTATLAAEALVVKDAVLEELAKLWQSAGREAHCSALTSLSPLRALHVPVGWKHFQNALMKLQPSVPMEELQRYEQLGKEFQNTKA